MDGPPDAASVGGLLALEPGTRYGLPTGGSMSVLI
jgi:hypothetical protein